MVRAWVPFRFIPHVGPRIYDLDYMVENDEEQILCELKEQPGRLQFLYGIITDLFVDFYKFKDQNVTQQVPQLQRVLDAYSLEAVPLMCKRAWLALDVIIHGANTANANHQSDRCWLLLEFFHSFGNMSGLQESYCNVLLLPVECSKDSM